MKKILTGIFVIGILVSAAGNSFAGLTKEYVRGKVISINNQTGEIVVMEDSSKNEMKFIAKRIEPGVEAGIRVLVLYKPGTNQATLVKPTKK